MTDEPIIICWAWCSWVWQHSFSVRAGCTCEVVWYHFYVYSRKLSLVFCSYVEVVHSLVLSLSWIYIVWWIGDIDRKSPEDNPLSRRTRFWKIRFWKLKAISREAFTVRLITGIFCFMLKIYFLKKDYLRQNVEEILSPGFIYASGRSYEHPPSSVKNSCY